MLIVFMIAWMLMVLAMTHVGSVIPALMWFEDQKKGWKDVVLPGLRLYQAAFPAFHNHLSRISNVVYKLKATKWIFKMSQSAYIYIPIYISPPPRTRFKNMKGKSVKKGRDWIMEKKERRRRQGRCVCILDSPSLLTKKINPVRNAVVQ